MPTPAIPPFSLEKMRAVLPDAIAIAILGAIESLLSAVVADGMSGRRHRSNSELVAQGVGNIAAAMTGGTPVTGTIARTATNIRAGARGPVAGILHSVYLLIFVMVAMPLVAYIPLAALAGVLVVVAWAMADKAEFGLLLRTSIADAVVLLVDLPAHDIRRSAHRHRGRRAARLVPVHAPHGGSDRRAGRRQIRARRCRRR